MQVVKTLDVILQFEYEQWKVNSRDIALLSYSVMVIKAKLSRMGVYTSSCIMHT